VLYHKGKGESHDSKDLDLGRCFHEQHGRWPTTESGVLADAPEQNWRGIDSALRYGIEPSLPPVGLTSARMLSTRETRPSHRNRSTPSSGKQR
jgi:hypothetical protein